MAQQVWNLARQLRGALKGKVPLRDRDTKFTQGFDQVFRRLPPWPKLEYGANDGPLGPMPASGRRFSTRGVQILHFDDSGRIVAHDNCFDQLSMMVQLGFARAPATS